MGDISKLVAAFVLIIVGAVLITQIAGQIGTATSLTSTTQSMDISSARIAGGGINESVYFYPTHFTEAASGWRAGVSGCGSADSAIYGSIAITNSTGSAWVDGVDTIINTEGSYTLVNTAKVNGTKNNQSTLTMNYCADSYVYGWAATIMLLIPGFFALALMGIGIGLFYMIAREHDIL